ncbi:hypothetical protein ET495_15500 [Xylanimonas allomyrinae]|uniref:Uncharacterized protein n=1 Tax=Xylanimonas allomyrinae TaxID=2509459 RepID=A0A4P6ENU3_9MICO|nr:hypothetical protein [Xylanimonas allomyrinae]QAY64382.1 hypothetical protein ET495_15500 [Xylanimonas allomyrinae]
MTRAFIKTKYRIQQALEGRERGASTIEYFGVVVVAVMLIVAMIAAFRGFNLGAKITTELNKIQG